MRGSTARVVAGVAVLVVAVVLFVALRDSGDSSAGDGGGATAGSTTTSTAKAKIPTIVIKGGEPVGGIEDLTYSQGDRIRFKVSSDVSDEIHVHGYDLMKDVEAGGSVSFDFPADLTGIFEAELEGRGVQIAELRVNP